MKRIEPSRIISIIFVVTMFFILILPACRELESGPDMNQPPNTILTSAPPETVNADYKVHLYWRGVDKDGTVERFMWYKSDSVMTLRPDENSDAELRDWHPDARKSDYIKGAFTNNTDSVFIFTGYDDGSWENKQAFHIVAIDDGGLMDPSPARLQFKAKVKGVPTVDYWIRKPDGIVDLYTLGHLDTISMFKNFSIGFRASTPNGAITGYRWAYGGMVLPDDDQDNRPEWFEDLEYEGGAIKVKWIQFKNDSIDVGKQERVDYVESGTFSFTGIARDEAGALSHSNILTGAGICKLVINHDPETEIMSKAFYKKRNGEIDTVYLKDSKPDTIPYKANLTLNYKGWDYPYDILQYPGEEEKKPIRYQFLYERFSPEYGGDAVRGWYPIYGAEDTNPNGPTDSTTMSVGSFNYIFSVRSFDEQSKDDGTPDSVSFVGNYPPHVDSLQIGFWDPYILKNLGEKVFRRVESGNDFYIAWTDGHGGIDPRTDRGDTLYIYNIAYDTGTKEFIKVYRFVLRAVGHDHPKDRAVSSSAGIKGWQYFFDDAEGDTVFDYDKEGLIITDSPTNLLEHELMFLIRVPPSQIVDTSFVNNPPKLFGEQVVTIIGKDIIDTKPFVERIRGISPEFDTLGNKISDGEWVPIYSKIGKYARRDTLVKIFNFQLVE